GAAMEWFLVWLSTLASLLASDELRWAGELGDLDGVRAKAFATADPDLLDRVYVAGSAALDADAAMIRAYEQRGARVTGAELLVLSCRVRDASAERIRLEVIDRLAPARVVWADGTSRALPRDLPTKRTVTLVRTADGWRIS
ncbi:MAG: hypothetical protein ABIN55_04135, partial [Aeromicrobium sp.]